MRGTDWAPIAWGTVVGLALIVWGAWRLAVAYRIYLQFRHAAAVVFCAEFIALLLTITFLTYVDNPLGEIYRRMLAHLFGAPAW
jgi:hypothetical protein